MVQDFSFEVLYTTNRVMLERQVLSSLLVAKLLLLAFILWKAVFLRLAPHLWIASLLLD